jgi:hypothetical protein
VYVAAPSPPKRWATSGISAKRAVAWKKNTAVRTSASFMRCDSRTYCHPRRIAPMKRSPGSTEGFDSRFQRLTTIAATTETAKLRANTYWLPADAMMRPATSGPTTREKFTATALRPSATAICERPTSSGTIAAYTGQRIARPMPLVNTSSSRICALRYPEMDTR